MSGRQIRPPPVGFGYCGYLTVKGKYPGYRVGHWRLTAVLQVVNRFESHGVAAAWYGERALELPRNCMVPENPPLSLDQTTTPHNYPSVRIWNAVYRRQVSKHSVFLACESLFWELHDPLVVPSEMLMEWFGRIPGTQIPPLIRDQQYRCLAALAGIE